MIFYINNCCLIGISYNYGCINNKNKHIKKGKILTSKINYLCCKLNIEKVLKHYCRLKRQ